MTCRRTTSVGLWGWLAVFVGIVWILVAFGLWALLPWARLFALIVAGISLFEAVLAMFQFTGTFIGLGMAIMPLLILWYLNTDEVKAAFAEGARAGRARRPPEARHQGHRCGRGLSPAPAARSPFSGPRSSASRGR